MEKKAKLVFFLKAPSHSVLFSFSSINVKLSNFLKNFLENALLSSKGESPIIEDFVAIISLAVVATSREFVITIMNKQDRIKKVQQRFSSLSKWLLVKFWKVTQDKVKKYHMK